MIDFVARQKVGGTNLNLFYLFQFPVLPPYFLRPRGLRFHHLPRPRTYLQQSNRWRRSRCELGYDGPPFAWDEDRRALLRAELDALYVRAYGLTRDELRYVLDPEDVMGPAIRPRPSGAEKNEIARFGEYRTARLVLAAWDAQEARPAAAQ